jgi:hypothetical protein
LDEFFLDLDNCEISARSASAALSDHPAFWLLLLVYLHFLFRRLALTYLGLGAGWRSAVTESGA